MQRVYILRGLPGSGKSTRTKQIQAHHGLIKQSSIVCSTDDFFTNKTTDKYEFNPRLLGVNHARNFDKFCKAIRNNIEVIIVDNCNIRRHDFKRYVEEAKKAGYEVVEEIIGTFDEAGIQISIQRNQHNVPESSIRRMAQNWEP